jgi:phage terminase Nu1 subunit (DNA packaging protein)
MTTITLPPLPEPVSTILRSLKGHEPVFDADQMHDYAAAVSADIAAENARLRSALERTATALRLAYSQKPLRDMAETLAEADKALKGASHE